VGAKLRSIEPRTVATIITAALLLAGTSVRAFDEELLTIPTRPGVSQPFLLLKPDRPPVASVILLAGGNGNLKLANWAIGGGRQGNFLVRSRALFAERGFLAAVVDASSDRTADGLTGFRSTEAHAQDIAGVVAFLKQRADVPVWLVGTSMGTVSAANAAARIPQGVDGLVLTSSVTRASRRERESLKDVNLKVIALPTLFVHNKSDACRVTPYADIPAVMQELTRAPKVELLGFEGGDTPRSDPCEAMSYHGYLGLESAVVEAIAKWIKATSRVK
jgi:pimeloyl-ACP methyl ester carboxylesterase